MILHGMALKEPLEMLETQEPMVVVPVTLVMTLVGLVDQVEEVVLEEAMRVT